MKFTKQNYINEIKELSKVLNNNNKMKERDELFAKNLDGRYYIHSKATKQQLENLYEDLVIFISDNRLN